MIPGDAGVPSEHKHKSFLLIIFENDFFLFRNGFFLMVEVLESRV